MSCCKIDVGQKNKEKEKEGGSWRRRGGKEERGERKRSRRTTTGYKSIKESTGRGEGNLFFFFFLQFLYSVEWVFSLSLLLRMVPMAYRKSSYAQVTSDTTNPSRSE